MTRDEFGDMARTEGPKVLAAVRARFHCKVQIAEDAVQEALQEMWETRHLYPITSRVHFRNRLKLLAFFKASNLLKRERRYVHPVQMPPPAVVSPIADWDKDRDLIQAAELLRKWLAGLPELQRLVIEEKYLRNGHFHSDREVGEKFFPQSQGQGKCRQPAVRGKLRRKLCVTN